MPKRNFVLIFALIAAISLNCFAFGGTNDVTGKNGMVVSVDDCASKIGIDILKKGGNAVDAAVAVGFALAVTYPAAGNIGGGGFMVIKFPDRSEAVALDFREMAPGKATSGMYLDREGKYLRDRSSSGYLAVGVPGTVKGFELAMKKYGALNWKAVLAPAIELAEYGFRLTKKRAESFNRIRKDFKNGTAEFLKVFTKPDGPDFGEGDLFTQRELAQSLKLISEQGSDAFYRGKIADLIVKDMGRNGGLVTSEDLNSYEAHERTPVSGTYRGYQILSVPPPSSGGTILIEMLNILEGYELGKMERYAPKTLHLMAETMKLAYFDRAKYLGDPDFGQIPVDRLISKQYAAEVRARILPDKAVPSAALGKEILTVDVAKETTHYSIIDKNGLAVSTTYTLNGGFGAGVVAAGTGILLNNEMDDFNAKPGLTNDGGLIGTGPNLIAPHKRMLSSMTSTIILKNGRVFLITGSPGGRTIINTVLNVVINVIDFRMPILDAVNAARMDHDWMPDVLRLERDGISDEVVGALQRMGHEMGKVPSPWQQGDAHSIIVDPKTGLYHGAADKRSGGSAIGY
jgi:gamma-glutamyltranspeptidase/glutathione hydrolase